MIALAALTQGEKIPSTRFRLQQHLSTLKLCGFDVTEFKSLLGAYPPSNSLAKPVWLLGSIVENAVRAIRSNNFDALFLQRNLTSTLCTWEPLLGKPLIFDVDDAIFLGPRGANANKIAMNASLIICGNNFLASHFSKFGKTVVLPTAVDTDYFIPRMTKESSGAVIGWSGSSSGFKYLYGIEPALQILLERHKDVTVKVVSDLPPRFEKLPPARVSFERWTADREAKVLNDFDIGIMPLDDDLWARGKCSFKMLTYMSAALPVVVSPVGMNADVLAHDYCGIGASSIDDWVDALSTLIAEKDLCFRLGQNGRKIVESRYAQNIIGPQLGALIKDQL